MSDELKKKSAVEEAQDLGGGYMGEPADVGLPRGAIPVVGLCPHCHTSVQPETLICPNCGAKLHELWPGKPVTVDEVPKAPKPAAKTAEFEEVMAGFRDVPQVYAMKYPTVLVRVSDGLPPTVEEMNTVPPPNIIMVQAAFSPKYVDVQSLCSDISMAVRDGSTVGLFSVVQEMGENGGIRARWAKYKVNE